MAKQFAGFGADHRAFIAEQPVYFVATSAPDARINLSPKGMDSLRVIGPNRLIWLNVTGSGNETAAHLPRDPRMTVMWCSFGPRPVGQVMVELPAGKLDAGEDPLVCGQRELLEETGYQAREWARAGHMHLAIAYSTEVIHIWFARGLRQGERRLDQGEFLDVFSATPDELMAWCRDGQVTDAKTLSCMVWVQNVLSGAWPLNWQTPDPISPP